MKLKLLVFLVLIIVALMGLFWVKSKKPDLKIDSFEKCAAAGNPVLESYPPQCKTRDGRNFTQNIGNELEKADKITISSPRPNQKITSPLKINGKARGGWFFEAQFPIKLVDNNGKTIGEAAAHADGEWMTENFVPYSATIEFKTEAKTGKLILEKDNPSGDPSRADELEVPVKF